MLRAPSANPMTMVASYRFGPFTVDASSYRLLRGTDVIPLSPKIIDLLDRMGVPFNRTAEGQRDLRLFGGSLFKRTFFAGATTGQQLLYALDEQTRRRESEGRAPRVRNVQL